VSSCLRGSPVSAQSSSQKKELARIQSELRRAREEVEALRAEVAELTERVDFAERLLARPRSAAEPPAYRS